MNNKYFLYVGNAYPHKNLNSLIRAIVLLNKNLDKKMVLKITSARNVFIDRLKESIKKFGATDYVELLGFVPDKNISDLYKNSVAFVFPSLSEGFGLPGLEAIESGTILCASDIPVFREVYKDEAVYFDPLDVDSIANVMRKVMQMNAADREKRIKSGKKFAKRYSWATMAKETLSIYEETKSRDSIRQGK